MTLTPDKNTARNVLQINNAGIGFSKTFILETGEIEMITEPKYSVGQNLYLTFYSENREDLTGDSLDIISLIQNRSIRFQRMDPNHLKLENQDRYIDQLVFTFRRLLKSDCHG
ncbi:hypothetical protein EfmAA610_24890 [Enterococcus faecium]|nr:hypothetical protein EfmAA610_24890 [Enterococcus faecium]